MGDDVVHAHYATGPHALPWACRSSIIWLVTRRAMNPRQRADPRRRAVGTVVSKDRTTILREVRAGGGPDVEGAETAHTRATASRVERGRVGPRRWRCLAGEVEECLASGGRQARSQQRSTGRCTQQIRAAQRRDVPASLLEATSASSSPDEGSRILRAVNISVVVPVLSFSRRTRCACSVDRSRYEQAAHWAGCPFGGRGIAATHRRGLRRRIATSDSQGPRGCVSRHLGRVT